jgi:hypothetical protein
MNHTYPPGTVVADEKTAVIPNEWIRFYTAANGTPPRTSGVPFVHLMKTQQGTERLVAVNIIRFGPPVLETQLIATTFTLGTLAKPPVQQRMSGIACSRGAKTTKVFAALMDKTDPSHLTINVVVDGKASTIDGWLKDEGWVLFERRENLTSPAPPSPPSSR